MNGIPILLAFLFFVQVANGQEHNTEHAPLTFATTLWANKTAVSAVHILAKSLIRTGHRNGLNVFARADVSPEERRELQLVPFTTIISAPSSKEICVSETNAVDECGLLRIIFFGTSALPTKGNIVYLPHDSVVLSSLEDLRTAMTFSAVQSAHSDSFDFDILVLRQDPAVSETLHREFCTGKMTAVEVLRKVIPSIVWTSLDDTFGMPAEQLDAAWYKQDSASPKIVRFEQSARPWKWWQDTSRFSLAAVARWYQAAEHTPYTCGWGNENNSETTIIARRAPAQPVGTTRVQQFAVLLSTYRRPIWRAITRHYVSMRIVSKVIDIWHDPKPMHHRCKDWDPKSSW